MRISVLVMSYPQFWYPRPLFRPGLKIEIVNNRHTSTRSVNRSQRGKELNGILNHILLSLMSYKFDSNNYTELRKDH